MAQPLIARVAALASIIVAAAPATTILGCWMAPTQGHPSAIPVAEIG